MDCLQKKGVTFVDLMVNSSMPWQSSKNGLYFEFNVVSKNVFITS